LQLCGNDGAWERHRLHLGRITLSGQKPKGKQVFDSSRKQERNRYWLKHIGKKKLDAGEKNPETSV
jgi:hypothetical protein